MKAVDSGAAPLTMVPGGQGSQENLGFRPAFVRFGRFVRGWALLGACFYCVTFNCHAAAAISADTPTGFFTNVASRLLLTQLGIDLTSLQIYPTNQYTPAAHRLLQVSANLYEATTNRAFVTTPADPYCPTVFRPLFRRTEDGRVIIAAYREISGTSMVMPATAPPMVQLTGAGSETNLIPSVGTPFGMNERTEPMVWGVPLIIGARKGFPNFNEFSMQTSLSLTRLLEFRRAAGNLSGPVVETNQMYALSISNIFGLEAWNSYSNPYPRNLQLIASVTMTAMLTNELGTMLLSNCVPWSANASSNAGAWPGSHSLSDLPASFSLPFGSASSFAFLSNSTYVSPFTGFMPWTHIFQANSGFLTPHWWFSMKSRLLFALVDTDAGRIVDYVNLDSCTPSVDLLGVLSAGADCSGNPNGLANPASQWCTNLNASGLPLGILNQISLSLGLNGTQLPSINSFAMDSYSGLDAVSAIDSFRYNLAGFGPIYPQDQNKTFYRSNVFYVPFDPQSSVYIHTALQANDPLVHYTLSDLEQLELSPTNTVDLLPHFPPLDNLGFINRRYQPWGGNPMGYRYSAILPLEVSAKDSLIARSDDWDFPTNQPLAVGWVGRIHRGTPWQTIYLKSTNILLRSPNLNQNIAAWQDWTGDPLVVPDWWRGGLPVADALFTSPTNDWAIATLLAAWFNTNDVRALTSPNQTSVAAWTSLLDGMTVLTNVSLTQVDALVMAANSLQATDIATGLLASRASQPGGIFHFPGDILATPELSIGSPWVNPSTPGPSDEAYESIPSQLLPLLRADSAGSIGHTGSAWQVQFTGFDGYAYALQESSDLLHWITVSTNYPSGGIFTFQTLAGPDAAQRFYRSVLLP